MTLVLLAFLAGVSAQDDVARARTLVQKLDSDDINERDAAAHELRKLAPKSAEVTQFLEKASRESPPDARARIASILEERRLLLHASTFVSDPEDFLARLRSPQGPLRSYAFLRAERLGADGAPFAADFLKADDSHASQALRIVGLSGDPRYIDRVRALLPVPNYRLLALDTLSRLGDLGIRADLQLLIESPKTQSVDAITQLGRLRQAEDIELFGRLLCDDQHPRSEAALVALRGWAEAQNQLSNFIIDRVKDQRGSAILLALELRDPRLLGVIKGIHDRPEALFARATLGDESVIPHLLRMAKYGPDVRLGFWGLGVLKVFGAVEQVGGGQPPKPDPSVELKRALEKVLQEYEVWDNQGSHIFRKRSPLGDRRGELPMALWAFGEIGGMDAERLAQEALRDRDEAVRYAACQALGRMRSVASIPQLVKSLDDALAFTPFVPVPSAPKRGEDPYKSFACVTQFQMAKGWTEVRQAAVQALEAVTAEHFEGTVEEKITAWKAWAARRADK